MSNSAEHIAKVMADLLAGRVSWNGLEPTPKVHDLALADIVKPTIIDATRIYDTLGLPEPGAKTRTGAPASRGFDLYTDFPTVAPPWDEFAVCVRNRFGNVLVMHCTVKALSDWSLSVPTRATEAGEPPWTPAEPIDWTRVRWRIDCFVWMGGWSTTNQRAIPTTGPIHHLQLAIYDDGAPADLHWVRINETFPEDFWDIELVTLLQSLNFLNCTNVEASEPARPRAERRRIERAGEGLIINTVNVWPVGKRRTSESRPEPLGLMPHHPVRGHFAHYGACCSNHEPRGLLFGKLTGRYFVPPHARGKRERGEREHVYDLRADKAPNEMESV